MSLRVLGPLQAFRDGRDVTPAAGKQRTVLALLALNPGVAVPAERLIDDLWGESPVGNARGTLHAYVSRLRKVLGDDVIVTSSGGYRLDLAHADVDLVAYDAAVHAADEAEEAGQPEAALELLRSVAERWQSEPLTNVPSDPLRQRVVPGLLERQLTVIERSAELELRLGRAAEVVTALRGLVDEHPLRERAWDVLMRALYAAGRPSEALAAYQQAAETLASELGVDPGETLRRTHQAILTESLDCAPDTDPAAVRPETPHELPVRPAGLVGRQGQLEQVTSWLADPDTSPLVLIAGAPGVGKSALAVAAAHQASARYPDGQLFVDLRGFSAERALTPADVLPRFLRALGVHSRRIPVDVDEQTALYRSRLAGRRVLVVLDNVATVDVVRPLVPGSPGSAVVVTSRNTLEPLVALDRARVVLLDVLSADEARQALADQVGEERVAAEPSAVSQLAEMCGHLPLALRVAGASLATRPPYAIASLVEELTLLEGPDSLVRTSFATSYAALDDDTRRVFRLLGLIPGQDLTAESLEAMTGASPRRALATLTAASLVDEQRDGRYRVHDLLRLYARDRADAENAEADREAARRRLFDWYIAKLDATANQLSGQHSRDRPANAGPWSLEQIDRELPNLMAAVHDTATEGPYELAWELADALRPYLSTRARYAEWKITIDLVTPVAGQYGDDRARAMMAAHAGRLHFNLGELTDAVSMLERARDLAAGIGDTTFEASVLQVLAIALHRLVRLPEAYATCQRAFDLLSAAGHERQAAALAVDLAHHAMELGHLVSALEGFESVRAEIESAGVTRTLAVLHDNLAWTQLRLGNLDEALDHVERNLRINHEIGLVIDLINGYLGLARVRLDRGEYELARAAVALAHDAAEVPGRRDHQLEVQLTLLEVDLRAGRPAAPILAELERNADEVARTELIGNAWMLELRTLANLRTGRPAEALALAEEGLEHWSGRHPLAHDGLLTAASAALVELGRWDEAIGYGDRALARHRETGYRLGEARTLCALGDAHSGRGEPALAREWWTLARDVYAAMGTQEIAQAARRLR
ncbi:AfsR/SARP family transcriptional regulator [Tenggerimyces flavus]|uniref:BTAD domain-containing putative transcriptional regulator n=1 Tax=Tenggerimyces flavus TaxID=1708749 RepID=A0ABV7Y8W0_9ACTN|nr:BTAD domain-containing putative transcriptional regulator [Tenggerimyces flavus]MBM7785623.1 DNA-binding SARP family transcriptional activator [Tenggerimyces flavus]